MRWLVVMLALVTSVVVAKGHTPPFNQVYSVGHIVMVRAVPECWRLDLSDGGAVCVDRPTWDGAAVGASYTREESA